MFEQLVFAGEPAAAMAAGELIRRQHTRLTLVFGSRLSLFITRPIRPRADLRLLHSVQISSRPLILRLLVEVLEFRRARTTLTGCPQPSTFGLWLLLLSSFRQILI